MQKSNQSNRRGTNNIAKTTNLVTVTLDDGTVAHVNTKKLSGWTKYSGTANDGTPVNSLSAKQIGRSTIIKNNQGKVFSCSTNELQVLTSQMFGAGNSTASNNTTGMTKNA